MQTFYYAIINRKTGELLSNWKKVPQDKLETFEDNLKCKQRIIFSFVNKRGQRITHKNLNNLIQRDKQNINRRTQAAFLAAKNPKKIKKEKKAALDPKKNMNPSFSGRYINGNLVNKPLNIQFGSYTIYSLHQAENNIVSVLLRNKINKRGSFVLSFSLTDNRLLQSDLSFCDLDKETNQDLIIQVCDELKEVMKNNEV